MSFTRMRATAAALVGLTMVTSCHAAEVKFKQLRSDAPAVCRDGCNYECAQAGYTVEETNDRLAMTSKYNGNSCTCFDVDLSKGDCGCICCSGNSCTPDFVGITWASGACSSECRNDFSDCPAQGNSGTVQAMQTGHTFAEGSLGSLSVIAAVASEDEIQVTVMEGGMSGIVCTGIYEVTKGEVLDVGSPSAKTSMSMAVVAAAISMFYF